VSNEVAAACYGDSLRIDPKRDPYWWVVALLAQTASRPLDTRCDVVIMGAGYTGLSAAITLARAGRSVQVHIGSRQPGNARAHDAPIRACEGALDAPLLLKLGDVRGARPSFDKLEQSTSAPYEGQVAP
jgi:FAD binding domain